MKPYRGTLLAAALLLAVLPLSGCGHDRNNGSGSYLRVTSVSPSNFEPDLFLTICSFNETTGEPVFEANAVTNHYASLTINNQSAPTTPTGESTNSFVTLSHYRVRFTGVSRGISLPDINEGGWTVGIGEGASATMPIVVMDLATIEYIRRHYPSVGNTESLTLRATISVWGEDAFHTRVEAEAQVILVVSDYTTCS